MLTAAALLCSCAGLTNISTPNSVALNQGNFKFVKNVSEETKATFILAIGGLSKRATADVVEKLEIKARLQPNQALADIRIKTTTKVFAFGFVVTRTLTATASVVEFYNTPTSGCAETISKGITADTEEIPIITKKNENSNLVLTEKDTKKIPQIA